MPCAPATHALCATNERTARNVPAKAQAYSLSGTKIQYFFQIRQPPSNQNNSICPHPTEYIRFKSDSCRRHAPKPPDTVTNSQKEGHNTPLSTLPFPRHSSHIKKIWFPVNRQSVIITSQYILHLGCFRIFVANKTNSRYYGSKPYW